MPTFRSACPVGTPLPWLARVLRPREARPPWPAMIQSVIALTGPITLAVATGDYGTGVLVSIGAIAAVLCDTSDAYHLRVLNIAVPQFVSAIGWLLGASVEGRGWTMVAAMVAIAFVSGFISSIGAVSSLTGMLFLLMAAIGAGTPRADPGGGPRSCCWPGRGAVASPNAPRWPPSTPPLPTPWTRPVPIAGLRLWRASPVR
ncbi:hypothetical protein ACIQV3_27580 [Streptomyces sp. NPDC099050]|uniref:hypothetical protein n=1 Tax=Streptomyces sp. NPDC099050 TaxID=3366100 RepID=UPI003815E36C